MGLDNPIHIAFIVVILLLVFGARRLPEIGRSLGTGMREFKQSVTGESHQQPAASPPQPPMLAAPQPQTPVDAAVAAAAQPTAQPAQPVAQPAAPAGESAEPVAQPAPPAAQPAPVEPQQNA
jgi:sec-independent protein translocase protein TatA